jgi:bifunctional UDP-N-acetylglucosamine pyrophosphorylase / glucosamine-1-phosphate N-acetyltransferase
LRTDFRVLIAAAGRGSRAGLAFPKTLYPVQGVPILLRILKLLKHYDSKPTIIVSPSGAAEIEECVRAAGYDAYFVIQEKPKGMGDAVLHFSQSPSFANAEQVLLVWGDIPFLQAKTVERLTEHHFKHANDFTFPTRVVDSAYTAAIRDAEGNVVDLIETRELGLTEPKPGERDIGLFLFRKTPVMLALGEDLPGKFGKTTGEHGFLYIVRHLVLKGLRVAALPVATELDLISLNRLQDLDGVQQITNT